jgi:pimeloyl-ACP methyl ester carboxylesterase
VIEVEVAGPTGPIGAIDWGGTGDPILLLHGGGTNAAEWAPLVPGLTNHYRCVSFDSYGHGRTPALKRPTFEGLLDEVDAVIDHLGLTRERLTLVGGSFGGALAIWHESVRPGCRAIVGLDAAPTSAHVGRRSGADRVDRTPEEYEAEGWGWSGDEAAYEARVATLVAEGEAEPCVRRAHKRGPDGLFQSVPSTEVIAALHNLGNRAGNPIVRVDNYALLRCPTLLLCATDGVSADNRWFVDSMPGRLPSVRVTWVEGPHQLSLRHSDLVARHITRLLSAV